ncbi:hypothetical protein AJ87_37745 [Rhizobium yanglingense]|nr:hypothetical protein AJ87_37745 [Rhizobium yanglingense]
MFGINGHALSHLFHIDDARHLARLAVVKGLDGRAEVVGMGNDGDQKVVRNDVQRKDRRAVGLGNSVELRQFLADQHEFLRILEAHLRRWRYRGSLRGERPEAALLARGRMADAALFDGDFTCRNLPFIRRRRNQHGAAVAPALRNCS